MGVAQPSIIRSAQAGHGRTLNVHRESKGENIGQNYDWMRGQPTGKPVAPRNNQQPTSTPGTAKPQQKPAQKPTDTQKPTNKPQQDSTDDSISAQHAVHGRDLAGKFQFNDSSPDYAIEQVIKAQGFDGKPTVCYDQSDFIEACKASNFIAKRGIGASDQRTLDAYDRAMTDGDFYVKCSGGSVHGYGMYAASTTVTGKQSNLGIKNAEAIADGYASGRAKKIYTMTLDKSAKIGTEKDLRQRMNQDTDFIAMCGKSSMRSRYTQDVGVYAAYKGYDAYIAGSGRSSKTGSQSDYTVILNRSKVIIFDSSQTPF